MKMSFGLLFLDLFHLIERKGTLPFIVFANAVSFAVSLSLSLWHKQNGLFCAYEDFHSNI